MNPGCPVTSLLLLLAGLLALVPLLLMAAEPSQPEDTAETLETLRQKHRLPALAAVVVKDGAICDRAAVGFRKSGDPTPVAANDVFHIGSITKSMTATLAAMFIEEGKLRWDTTIAEIFPELQGRMDRQYETVTVEQLLLHRGGFPTPAPKEAWARAVKEIGTPVAQRLEYIAAALAERAAAAPGTKKIYSNAGYAVVGAMLEKIAACPWETLITGKLFQPLHMDSAGFGPPGSPGMTDQPWGHRFTSSRVISSQRDNPPAISPAGRVHCSLDDLARYAMAHLEGERTGGLLRAETFRRLHTPPAGGIHACGWICADPDWPAGRVIWHNGSNTWWYAIMWLALEKNAAVIVATNCATADAIKAGKELGRALANKWLVN
jgi:CubicO group peptidase (beta-lactamase class C family)